MPAMALLERLQACCPHGNAVRSERRCATAKSCASCMGRRRRCCSHTRTLRPLGRNCRRTGQCWCYGSSVRPELLSAMIEVVHGSPEVPGDRRIPFARGVLPGGDRECRRAAPPVRTLDELRSARRPRPALRSKGRPGSAVWHGAEPSNMAEGAATLWYSAQPNCGSSTIRPPS